MMLTSVVIMLQATNVMVANYHMLKKHYSKASTIRNAAPFQLTPLSHVDRGITNVLLVDTVLSKRQPGHTPRPKDATVPVDLNQFPIDVRTVSFSNIKRASVHLSQLVITAFSVLTTTALPTVRIVLLVIIMMYFFC